MHQMFPALSAAEMDRVRRFGEVPRFAPGQALFVSGEAGPGMFVVPQGTVAITQRDGMGRVVPIVRQSVGQFLAEVGQLSDAPAMVDGHAEDEVEVLLVPPGQLRALILRRVALIKAGASGPVLIGQPQSAEVLALIHQHLAQRRPLTV
jgi:thioredoxin reductase (NADPH)